MSSWEVALVIASGLATGIGGIGLLLFRRPSHRSLDTLLGFTAGVMLAASVFSLLVPALDRGQLWEIVVGLALGTGAILALDEFVPHVHDQFTETGGLSIDQVESRERAGLLLSALTIHNVPEGMAVGVAFGAGGTELGVPIAIAIGIQNIPEGFAAGAGLIPAGVSRRKAATVALATGFVEPPAAFAAFALVEVAGSLLAGALAFAAGAMIYVIADELIPESHGHGFERAATLALVAGFILMLTLDNAFG